jgi:peptidoglycan/xylan/chitin deacetylase (PgdA/CDA1 family)
MGVDVINYHYIRTKAEDKVRRHAREASEFDDQIQFICDKYHIVNPCDKDELGFYLSNMSQHAVLITFDDGYVEHYAAAVKLLDRGVSSILFPVTSVLETGTPLVANLVHILLGTYELPVAEVLSEIRRHVRDEYMQVHLDGREVSIEEYMAGFKDCNHFDTVETSMVKRLLQRDISKERKRRDLCYSLLNHFSVEYVSYLSDLYLSVEKLAELSRKGIVIGTHTHDHCHLAHVSSESQRQSISTSLQILQKYGLMRMGEPISLAYPYGSHSDEVLVSAQACSVDYGFTTIPGRAVVEERGQSKLRLRRWDTNDWWCKEKQSPTDPTL